MPIAMSVKRYGGTWDPETGVTIGSEGMSALELLAVLDLARQAVLQQIAPERSRPLARAEAVNGTPTLNTSTLVARHVGALSQ